jgi:hypothetical protein
MEALRPKKVRSEGDHLRVVREMRRVRLRKEQQKRPEFSD